MEDLFDIILNIIFDIMPKKLGSWLDRQGRFVRIIFTIFAFALAACIVVLIIFLLWCLFVLITGIFGGNYKISDFSQSLISCGIVTSLFL